DALPVDPGGNLTASIGRLVPAGDLVDDLAWSQFEQVRRGHRPPRIPNGYHSVKRRALLSDDTRHARTISTIMVSPPWISWWETPPTARPTRGKHRAAHSIGSRELCPVWGRIAPRQAGPRSPR